MSFEGYKGAFGRMRCLAEGGVAWLPDAPRKWWPWHSELLSIVIKSIACAALPRPSALRIAVCLGPKTDGKIWEGGETLAGSPTSCAPHSFCCRFGFILLNMCFAFLAQFETTAQGLPETVSLSWRLVSQCLVHFRSGVQTRAVL